jgi:hypothetical protein
MHLPKIQGTKLGILPYLQRCQKTHKGPVNCIENNGIRIHF